MTLGLHLDTTTSARDAFLAAVVQVSHGNQSPNVNGAQVVNISYGISNDFSALCRTEIGRLLEGDAHRHFMQERSRLRQWSITGLRTEQVSVPLPLHCLPCSRLNLTNHHGSSVIVRISVPVIEALLRAIDAFLVFIERHRVDSAKCTTMRDEFTRRLEQFIGCLFDTPFAIVLQGNIPEVSSVLDAMPCLTYFRALESLLAWLLNVNSLDHVDWRSRAKEWSIPRSSHSSNVFPFDP